MTRSTIVGAISRSRLPWLLSTLALGASGALAAEMRVQGEVVEVVPITRSGAVAAAENDCQPLKPLGGNLIALLEWDLRASCPSTAHQQISAYRVYYRWDGRTYSQVMREPPGDTVPLRVRIR